MKLIPPLQVILGFLILGICGGFENDTISLTAAIIGIVACVSGIYILHRIEENLEYKRARIARLNARKTRYDRAA